MTYRRLNESEIYRDTAENFLWAEPYCEVCSERVATEIHITGGCLREPPLSDDEITPVCRACHDDTGCTAYPDTPTHRFCQSL